MQVTPEMVAAETNVDQELTQPDGNQRLIGRALGNLLGKWTGGRLSWSKISSKIDVSGSTLSRLRGGQIRLSSDVVQRISTGLGKDVHLIYTSILEEALEIRSRFGDVIRMGDRAQDVDQALITNLEDGDIYWTVGLERPGDWASTSLKPHVSAAIEKGVLIRFVQPVVPDHIIDDRLDDLDDTSNKALPPPVGLEDVLIRSGSVNPVREYRLWKRGIMGMFRYSAESEANFETQINQFNEGINLFVTPEDTGLLFYAPFMRYIVIQRKRSKSFEAWIEVPYASEGELEYVSQPQRRVALKLGFEEAKLLDRWCRYVPTHWSKSGRNGSSNGTSHSGGSS